MVNGAIVVSPPGGYVPPVSNGWKNTFDPAQSFQLTEDNFGATTGTFTVDFRDNFILIASGTGTYDKANNYIEFTLAGIRYVGIWTPRTTFNGECFYHMTLISAESGKQLELSINTFNACD
ncbi:MAG: hypothetical protein IPJ20_21090 [Flammeovirgaceae bacterium]|nr:hypothetical protein [Flammeovirgaceae bacterium]